MCYRLFERFCSLKHNSLYKKWSTNRVIWSVAPKSRFYDIGYKMGVKNDDKAERIEFLLELDKLSWT